MRNFKLKLLSICIIVCYLVATMPTEAVTWNGYVEATAKANDPPAPAHNPADVNNSFTVDSSSPKREWVPKPPAAEANWDNDNWVSGGNFSWHIAVSGATQAESKAKAGLNANAQPVVVARARVRDILDGNLGNNGGDNSALSTSKATMIGGYIIIVGPTATVEATLHTEAYMACPPASPAVAVQGTCDDTCTFPVNKVFPIIYFATARAQYPILIPHPWPGSYVGYELMVDGSTEASGSATLLAGEPEPQTEGGMAGMAFMPWTTQGPNGEWHEESSYGAIIQTLILPPGYKFVKTTGTIAYWRFDDVGDPNIEQYGPVAPGNPLPDSDGLTGWQTGIPWRKAAHDWSGNGNHLTTWEWDWAGHNWSSDVPAATVPLTGASNTLSIVNAGDFPCVYTHSEYSGSQIRDIETISPAEFTVEASFKASQLGSYHTIVGRDGNNVWTGHPEWAPFYFSVRPPYSVAIEFTDVSGYNHVAESAPNLVTTGQWYNMVGVSDGKTLSLYLNNILVAQTDLTASGSPDTRMAIGNGSGDDWEAGTWSVGRGMWNGQHVDRFFGNIDEVRISDVALPQSKFLFFKWFPHFWFLNARIRLVWTPGYITIPTGYWGGWWWWHHQCHWFYPWYGPVGWWWPYCYQYPYWSYWPYWPYYRYYHPWWHYWHWRGGPWFWGFKDCLTFRYLWWRPYIIYWWSYYWDPAGQGNGLELVTMSDEGDPAGGRILPLDPNVISNLEVESHQFSVNGGKVEGEFSQLQFIQTMELENYYRNIPDVKESDVQAFMSSDIVKELMKNDPNGEGYVGVQYAQWQHPRPPLTVSDESIALDEGSEAQYSIGLPEPNLPEPVRVRVVSSKPERLLIRNQEGQWDVDSFFDVYYEMPQTVTIMAVDDTLSEGEETVMLANFLENDPNEGFPLAVTIQDDECGGKGYHEADLNHDCKVNFSDFAIMADGWLTCTDPGQQVE